jgi:hypothetical protein
MRAVSIGICGGAGLGLGAMLALAAGPAAAQESNNPTQIHDCLCLEQQVEATSQAMNNATQALAAARQHLADLNAELARERPLVNVNNPNSVDHYKALLEERDAAYRESIGSVVTDADRAVTRYNALVNRYDGECANHPFNSEILHEEQANLSCPAPPP